jgi:hypothetical protein
VALALIPGDAYYQLLINVISAPFIYKNKKSPPKSGQKHTFDEGKRIKLSFIRV